MTQHYKVEPNPLASIKKCDAKAVEKYLEAQASRGLALVAVVDVTGAPHWIFRVHEQKHVKPVEPVKPAEAKPAEAKPAEAKPTEPAA